MSSEARQFYLEDVINSSIPGVTKVQAAQHLEACLVCLDHNHRAPGAELLVVYDLGNEKVLIQWSKTIDEHIRRSWNDIQEATEYGATAIAILLVLNYTEYTIIERSVKGTGFDYWLLEASLYDENILFPQGSARLEVSGIIRAEKDSEIKARVKQKLKQTEISDSTYTPALIIVVEFGRPEAHMVYKS